MRTGAHEHDSVGGSGPLADVAASANNVLLLSPGTGHGADELCADLLAVAPPDEEHVLWVALGDDPDDRIDAWRAAVGARLPAEAGIVHVDGETRSAAAASTSPTAGEGTMAARRPEPVDDVSIGTVPSPGDLTGLGIALSGYCSRWADGEEAIAVCVHDLSTLLRFAGTERVFRFLHTVMGRLAAVDATAHYHLDPAAHDEREVNKLKLLFDAIVEPEDEEWAVTTR